MTTYRIGLVQTVTEETTIMVEAGSREEAERLAIGRANMGEAQWNFLEAHNPVEVVSVDEIPTPRPDMDYDTAQLDALDTPQALDEASVTAIAAAEAFQARAALAFIQQAAKLGHDLREAVRANTTEPDARPECDCPEWRCDGGTKFHSCRIHAPGNTTIEAETRRLDALIDHEPGEIGFGERE